MGQIDAIKQAKAEAGTDSYLWLHTSGDCILWPSEEASENDDGAHALARWQLSEEETDALIDMAIADEVA